VVDGGGGGACAPLPPPPRWLRACAQNIELFKLALSGITIILIPDKDPKYRTVRLNTGHLATLNMKYNKSPRLLDDLDPPLPTLLPLSERKTMSTQ